MRHWAWLGTRKKDAKKARIETLSESSPHRVMPEPGPYSYLIGLLKKIGPSLNVGNGPFALNWQEIEAWERRSGIALSNWEAETIRSLSGLYASCVTTYSGENIPAPYSDQQGDRSQLNQEIDSAFRDFFRQE